MKKNEIVKVSIAYKAMKSVGFNNATSDAVEELARITEKFMLSIAQEAKDSMEFGGRKKPTHYDIKSSYRDAIKKTWGKKWWCSIK